MNYYRRYVGDYLRDTARLSLTEHGAYNLLLDYYYAEERPLPIEVDDVCRMIRAVKPEERRAVEKVLKLYFVLQDDGFHNARADAELQRATPLIQSARENGKKGGRRKNQTDGLPTGLPTGVPTGLPTGLPTGVPNGQHTPTTNHQPPTTNHHPPSPNLKVKPTAQDCVLPPGVSGVSEEIWRAFIEHRKKLRKPMTDRAAKLILAKIGAIGQNPSAVIEQSIERGWAGVFPLDASKGHHHGKSDAIATTRRLMEAAMAEEKLDAGAAQSFGGDVRASLPDPQR